MDWLLKTDSLLCTADRFQGGGEVELEEGDKNLGARRRLHLIGAVAARV